MHTCSFNKYVVENVLQSGNCSKNKKEPSRRTVHEKPVTGQHPDEHQHDGEREGQELSQSETPTAAEGNPAGKQTPSGRREEPW